MGIGEIFTTNMTQGTAITNQTYIFGTDWILTLLIVCITMLLLSRTPSEWITLLLPITLGWKIAGLDIPYIFVALAATIFTIENLSMKFLSGSITGATTQIQHTTDFIAKGAWKGQMTDYNQKRYELAHTRRTKSIEQAYQPQQEQILLDEKHNKWLRHVINKPKTDEAAKLGLTLAELRKIEDKRQKRQISNEHFYNIMSKRRRMGGQE